MSPRVVLVGPPGAGKTTIGRKLAARLRLVLVDTDQLVERESGRSVSEIFTTDGEATFRALEEQAVCTALQGTDTVVSLGGGAVLSARTRTLLAEHTVAFLAVGMAEGVRRTGLGAGRPLLVGLNPRATFKALLDARLALYREVATFEVSTDGLTPTAVATAVLARL